MNKKILVKGLELKKVSKENIELFLQLKEFGEKLGFKVVDWDGKDGEFLVTFSIKEEFNS